MIHAYAPDLDCAGPCVSWDEHHFTGAACVGAIGPWQRDVADLLRTSTQVCCKAFVRVTSQHTRCVLTWCVLAWWCLQSCNNHEHLDEWRFPGGLVAADHWKGDDKGSWRIEDDKACLQPVEEIKCKHPMTSMGQVAHQWGAFPHALGIQHHKAHASTRCTASCCSEIPGTWF